MNIVVHIERLILDGIPLPQQHRPLVQTAMEEELARLLALDGLASDFQQSHVQQRIQAGVLEVKDTDEPAVLGRNIARAVYKGIGQ
jgi:hypothetical protein